MVQGCALNRALIMTLIPSPTTMQTFLIPAVTVSQRMTLLSPSRRNTRSMSPSVSTVSNFLTCTHSTRNERREKVPGHRGTDQEDPTLNRNAGRDLWPDSHSRQPRVVECIDPDVDEACPVESVQSSGIWPTTTEKTTISLRILVNVSIHTVPDSDD